MKTPIALIVCVAAVSAVAGDFVNLTFDQPELSRTSTRPGSSLVSGPVEDLLRGWEVSTRPLLGQWQPYTGLVEMSLAIGGTPVALSTFSVYQGSGFGVSMLGMPDLKFPGLPPPQDVRLSTKGTVPEGALTFDLYESTGVDLTISDGVRIITRQRDQTSMNVSQFAGKEVTISFIQKSGGSVMFDVIGFTLVPEPETWALLGVGLVGLFAWCQYNRA